MKKTIMVAGIIAVLLLALISGCNGQDDSGKGSLKVTITSGGTAPISGAKVVSESQPDGQLKVTGITTDNGTVIFSDMLTGTYKFYVSAAGFLQMEFETNIIAGQTAETTVYMAPEP